MKTKLVSQKTGHEIILSNLSEGLEIQIYRSAQEDITLGLGPNEVPSFTMAFLSHLVGAFPKMGEVELEQFKIRAKQMIDEIK